MRTNPLRVSFVVFKWSRSSGSLYSPSSSLTQEPTLGNCTNAANVASFLLCFRVNKINEGLWNRQSRHTYTHRRDCTENDKIRQDWTRLDQTSPGWAFYSAHSWPLYMCILYAVYTGTSTFGRATNYSQCVTIHQSPILIPLSAAKYSFPTDGFSIQNPQSNPKP